MPTPASTNIDLSAAFDHEDPEEGQKIYDKLVTPHIRHKLAKHVSDHLLGSVQGAQEEMGLETVQQKDIAAQANPQVPLPGASAKHKLPKSKDTFQKGQGFRSMPGSTEGGIASGYGEGAALP